MINFPETAEQIEKFKAEGLDFDKIIYLVDTNEDDPGKVFLERNANNDTYNHERALEIAAAWLALYKEQFEDKVVEVSCNGSADDVFTRILTALDPF